MDKQTNDRLDAFGRRHPGLMLCATLLMAALTMLLYLSTSDTPTVLYQAF